MRKELLSKKLYTVKGTPTEHSICPDMHSKGGYMTLFSCLMFLVLMGAVFLCLDGSVIRESESRVKMAAVGAGEHVLANYSKELEENYNIYFLDPRMEEVLESRIKTYFKEILLPAQSLSGQKQKMPDIRLEDVKAQSFGSMQEDECLYLKHEIKELIKYDSTTDLIKKSADRAAHQMEHQSREISQIRHELNQKEAESEEIKHNPGRTVPNPGQRPERDTVTHVQIKDPRRLIRRIMKQGMLGFVTEDRQISESAIPSYRLPSRSQKEKMENISDHPVGSLSDIKKMLPEQKINRNVKKYSEDFLMFQYMKKYFNCYTRMDKKKDTVLDHEMEYLLGGQETDKENLRYVVNRLVLLRFGIDYVYAVTDSGLSGTAETVAAAIAGVTGIPAVVEGVKYTILGAVSFGEALLDVQKLLRGEEVPLLKKKENWQLTLLRTGELKKTEHSVQGKGLTYEDYLYLLFGMQRKKERIYLRMQDLMQVNIQKDHPGFFIDQCRFGFRMQGIFKIHTEFGHGTYELYENREYTY